jgi:hypothetical protein
MFSNAWGIEIEVTGITRERAAKVAADFLGGTVSRTHDAYDAYEVTAPDGRTWKFMSDASIKCQKKEHGRIVPADREYSVELVSPILHYREDIETLQELVRRLRKAGSFCNSSVGCHIHLDGSNHTPRSIRNFIIQLSQSIVLYLFFSRSSPLLWDRFRQQIEVFQNFDL